MNSSPVARSFAWLLRGYQHLSTGTAPRCRFLPTCSQYALEAVETRGAAMGAWLALRRLARCHPWGGHGYDPVPPRPTRPVPYEMHRRHAHGA